MVRHACAGHKGDWAGGPDDERPLDPAGRQQAEALAEILAAEGPTRLVASPTRRCLDTLAPLGETLGLVIETEPALRETTGVGLVRLLAADACAGAAVCTHGEVMEPALALLRTAGLEVVDDVSDEDLLLKGAAWRLDPAPPGWRLELVAPIPLASCPHHDGPR
ncbi:MAG TPA: histidine phosphatase family protein [Iamia sp.]